MNHKQAALERKRNSADIGVWDNEGGAERRTSMDHHFGRRIEVDRTWTVYHVFTGIVAQRGGEDMTGMTKAHATDSMLSLNLRNIERRKARAESAALDAPEQTQEGQTP